MHQDAAGNWIADTSDEQDEVNNRNLARQGIGTVAGVPKPVVDVPPAGPTAAQRLAAAQQADANGQRLQTAPDGSFTFVPIAGAPQQNPVTRQTTPGTSALTADLAARQAGSAATTSGFAPTSVLSPTKTVDPKAALNAAAASGVLAGRSVAPSFSAVSTPLTMAPRAAPATAPVTATGFSLAPTTVASPTSKVATAATQAQAALGPAPKIDTAVADRQQANVNAALGLSKDVVGAALKPVDNTALNAATSDARGVLNRALAPQDQSALNAATGDARTVLNQALTPQDQSALNAATGDARNVLNQALAPQNQAALLQANADARALLDQMLNGPNTADRIGSQVLRNQLALARSASGGPGAVQEALRGAENASPELEATAADAATRETLARQQAAAGITGALQQSALGQQQNENTRLGTAGSVSGVLAQSALGQQQNENTRLNAAGSVTNALQQSALGAQQNENTRLGTAGSVTSALQQSALGAQQNDTARLGTAATAASGFAQGALGAKGQDIQVAQSNQQAATALMQSVQQLTGTQLEMDQRNQELLGQMSRDMAAQDFNWAKLSADQQNAEWDRWVKAYGIDQQVAATLQAAAIASKKGVMDYVVPIIGSLATVGAAIAKG